MFTWLGAQWRVMLLYWVAMPLVLSDDRREKIGKPRQFTNWTGRLILAHLQDELRRYDPDAILKGTLCGEGIQVQGAFDRVKVRFEAAHMGEGPEAAELLEWVDEWLTKLPGED